MYLSPIIGIHSMTFPFSIYILLFFYFSSGLGCHGNKVGYLVGFHLCCPVLYGSVCSEQAWWMLHIYRCLIFISFLSVFGGESPGTVKAALHKLVLILFSNGHPCVSHLVCDLSFKKEDATLKRIIFH